MNTNCQQYTLKRNPKCNFNGLRRPRSTSGRLSNIIIPDSIEFLSIPEAAWGAKEEKKAEYAIPHYSEDRLGTEAFLPDRIRDINENISLQSTVRH